MRRLLPSFAVALLLVPGPVWAALRVPAPAGWDRGSMVPPQTFADAESLAQRSGSVLIDVFAGPGQDDYVESVVVLERAEPLDPDALADAEAARIVATEWAQAWVDEPGELEISLVDRNETTTIEASFEADGVTWMLLIAPTGATTGAVVVRGQADELALYRRTFREVFETTEGAEPPVEPIDRGRSRMIAIFAWLLGGAAAGGVGLSTAPVGGDLRHASRRAAIILAGAATFAAAVLVFVFLGKVDAVKAGGASPIGFGLELAAYGLALAGAAFAVSVFGPEPKRIQSAPDTVPRLPTAKPGELRPSTVPSRLEPADTRSTIPPNDTIEVRAADPVPGDGGRRPREDTRPRALSRPKRLVEKRDGPPEPPDTA